MARVTVEDCVLRVPNRFELVMLAAQRGRNLGAGTPPSIDRDNDKNPVIALREIAEGTVNLEELEQGLIRGLQKIVEPDEPEAEELELLGGQDEFVRDAVGAADEAAFADDETAVDEDDGDGEDDGVTDDDGDPKDA